MARIFIADSEFNQNLNNNARQSIQKWTIASSLALMEAVFYLVFSTRWNNSGQQERCLPINPIVSLQIIFGREPYYLMLNKLGC